MSNDLESVFNTLVPGASPVPMTLAFLAAFGLSGMMAWVYKVSSGEDYDSDIAQSQILLACIMTLVLMVVGDSISRAFGAVGILGVIRFRSNVKNSAEAATLLSSVAVGMACGVGLFRVAIAGALFLSLIQVILRSVFEPTPRPAKKPKKDAEAPTL